MVQEWRDGDGALQVALDHVASSFGEERIPVPEAAATLRSLAGRQTHLLSEVARAKLEAHRQRGYQDQMIEMYAAAALLRAGAPQSVQQPTAGAAGHGLTA